MIDELDLQILHFLKEDSRRQWKEIGELVHLTGQAVSARIRKMEDAGIIKGFSISIDEGKLGNSVTALITVFMTCTNHKAFHKFLKTKTFVSEAHLISGEGCYWLKISVPSQQEVVSFLDELLQFGNCRVNMSMNQIK